MLSLDQIQTIGRDSGFAHVAVLSRRAAEEVSARHALKLADWQESGFAGDMQYMNRPAGLFQDFSNHFPEAKSVVIFLVSYRPGDVRMSNSPPPGFGRVARYAWGRDYHKVLKKRLQSFLELAGQALGGAEIKFRMFSDAVPLLERGLAEYAGLGFFGRNTILIRPGVGSFTFIAEVLWDVEVAGVDDFTESSRRFQVPGTSCGGCTQCIPACPTDAIIESGKIDARRCISYLTIEKRAALDQWERQALGHWVFGCDVCQEVCPFNHENVESTAIDEFSPQSGSGSFLDLCKLLECRSNEAFLEQFGGTALMRAGRAQLLRNACCVLANTNHLPAIPLLQRVLKEDADDLVRSHAQFALAALAPAAYQANDGFYLTEEPKRRITCSAINAVLRDGSLE